MKSACNLRDVFISYITSCGEDLVSMTCKNYNIFLLYVSECYSSNIGVPEKTTEGILFCPVEYTISNSGAEKVGSTYRRDIK